VPFDEEDALPIVAVRAIEQAERARTLWTDEDRAWASRAAAETVGADGGTEAFVGTRARLALDRMGGRNKWIPRAVRALRWRPWVGFVVVAAAFVAGVAVDQLGGARRINLLALPLILLLLWNVAVYVLLAAGFVVRYGDAMPAGPLRGLVVRLAGGGAGRARGEWATAISDLAGEWLRLATPLYAARAARILHVASALFAAGIVAGLYVRGVVFEYHATWESTFLDASTVRSLLNAMLLPGSALTGLPVPPVAEVAAIRAPVGENAARWLHLMAATVAIVVIVPRLLLAFATWLVERHRRCHVPLAPDEPYFARLLRGYRGGPLRVHVAPYSYTLPGAAAAGVERLVRGAFGANAALTLRAPVPYGGEDALAAAAAGELPASDRPTATIAVFNATATPEREAHGAFLDALAAQLAPGGTLTAVIDEGAFRERWGSEPDRIDARRAAWRGLCDDRRVGCAFADLAAPDVAAATSDLERALEAPAR
jgi:hypothetical protein